MPSSDQFIISVVEKLEAQRELVVSWTPTNCFSCMDIPEHLQVARGIETSALQCSDSDSIITQ